MKYNSNDLYHIIKLWVLPFLLLTTIFVSVFATAQFTLRSDANDPQLAIAIDYKNSLEAGTPLSKLPSLTKVNPYESLSPFVIIYDVNQKVVASSLPAKQSVPNLPSGVLDNVRQKGSSRLTWEPTSDLRLATVIYKVKGNFDGYVLVASNLAEVENRIQFITAQVFVAYLATLILLALYNFLRFKHVEEVKKNEEKEIRLEIEKEKK